MTYDKRHESFIIPPGHAMYGQRASNVPTRGLADVGHPLLQLSTETFLSQLPASTIVHGHIHSIRQEIGQLILPPVDIPVECRVVCVPGEDAKVATLGIRMWRGAQTIQLHVPYTITLHQVKEYIATESGHCLDTFDMASSFPSKAYENELQTVETAGLVPSATLHLKMR
ncbi:hypothetical protein H257_11530 [Aphanomyces astaci]|uniref:UBX domain-containing protein n=1 Tax=Aphanomyces astaci TaxID=112090 RepID=W4G2C3_APHAT|nr:hypothetical protein H257_11530 [Aphanomyces astaci]ETV73872.1 hypothetical protein H257_11530 [Aphanomyces astaci]|eukprot:XP_009836808.1 hypothetical protein H257_11530 [Aphanomyces astaci]